MRPLVSARESLELDARAVASGSDPDLPVERAASGMARRLAAILDGLPARAETGPRHVVAIAGRGSNGADALAVLRLLEKSGRDERLTAVLAFSRVDAGPGPASRQLSRLEGSSVGTFDFWAEREACLDAIGDADLVLEGLVGTGATDALREPAAGLVVAANEAPGLRVAVDLPAGIVSGGTVFRADATLMVAPLKEIAFRPSRRAACGAILPIEGVFEPGAGGESGIRLVEATDLSRLLPRLAPDDHKGRRGKVGIWAGAVGTTGAASLACGGAVAAGSGVARLRTRPEIWAAIAARLEDGLVAPIGSARDESAFADGMDALLAGPGWGAADPAPAILSALLGTDRPLVIDADALGLLASAPERAPRKAPLVLTPHPGELARLSGKGASAVLDDPVAVASPFAERQGAVVCARAATTWIVAPGGRTLVVDGLEPSLACAGSGDVFAGILAGLLARSRAGDPERLDPAALAAAAALAHVGAGRALAASRGFYGASRLAAEAARIIHAASTAGRPGAERSAGK